MPGVNPLEVLELSLEDIRGKDDNTIEELVNSAHGGLYAKTVGGGANIPRTDGLSNAEYQTRLNDAKRTLVDPQQRADFLAGLSEAKAAEEAAATEEAAREAAEKAKEAASEAAEQAREAAKQAAEHAATAVKHIVNASGIITAIGVCLVASGIALGYFDIPEGEIVTMIGLLVLPLGFTGFLYNGGTGRAVTFAVVGVILMVTGFVLTNYPDLFGRFQAGYFVRILGGGALLCNLVALVLKYFIAGPNRTVATGTISYLLFRWRGMTATWIPMVRMGVSSIAIALLLLPIHFILIFLIGIGIPEFFFGVLFWGGVALVVIGFYRGRRVRGRR